MKTKTINKQRKQSRELDVMSDLRSEFDELYDDLSIIDEVAYAELLENED